MIDTGKAARAFFDAAPKSVKEQLKRSGRTTVVGFTGSPIWHMAYAFPPHTPGAIEKGYAQFAADWKPILDAFDKLDVNFALEVHPTEIAFDIAFDAHGAAGGRQPQALRVQLRPDPLRLPGRRLPRVPLASSARASATCT